MGISLCFKKNRIFIHKARKCLETFANAHCLEETGTTEDF